MHGIGDGFDAMTARHIGDLECCHDEFPALIKIQSDQNKPFHEGKV